MGFIYLIKKYYLLKMQGKKGAEANVNAKLNLVIKSGKFMIGYRNTIKAMRRGEAKLIIIANNCPAIRRTELEYYAALCGSAVHNSKATTSSSVLHAVSSSPCRPSSSVIQETQTSSRPCEHDRKPLIR